jgi:general secretion pathway protein G
VLVILSVLAGIVVVNLAGNSEKARIIAARTQISNFKTSLTAFEIDNGRYPTADEGLAALVEPPSGLDYWHPYMDKLPLDPWGREYVYELSDVNGWATFQMWSAGPDGQLNTEDDITE